MNYIEGRIFYDRIDLDLVKLKANDSSTAIWNIPGLKAIWHFLDAVLGIQSLVTIIHPLSFMRLIWFTTHSGHYTETVVSVELW